LLEPTPVPAPRLLAVTDGTDTGGVSAILMSRVAGHVDLAPRDRDDWLRQMATMLAEIQQLEFEFPAYEPARRAAPDDDLSWVPDEKLWRRALALVQEGPPSGPRCFTHSDFQHFNLLWSRQRLTGVVDWAYPVVTSPDLDAAHCRLNLVVLF